MLSLPVCGTAHRVFCRSCPSIPSSHSRLRPKRSKPPHWARKTTWICSDNACYPDKRYPFSNTSKFLSIRTVQSRRFTGKRRLFALTQDSLQSAKIRSASDALAHASSLSASSLHSPQECFARSAFAASIADADMDRLVTPRPHSTGAMPAVPAISPHTPTSIPFSFAALAVMAIRRSTPGCSGRYR